MKLKDVTDPLAKEAYEEWKELGGTGKLSRHTYKFSSW